MKLVKIDKRGVWGDYFAYIKDKNVGVLRRFCCGIDFVPKGNKNAMFSILKVRYRTKELSKCVEELSKLKMPKAYFHWNFNYALATDEERLKDYQERLLLIDKKRKPNKKKAIA